ncbi:TnsA endonuclease N-terminal domain-containing protein [Lysinibacillus boronitolerans]|nr:TnsA endonuclease N-terminal domain-containing protein [Lysinibacillus boronitolerans]
MKDELLKQRVIEKFEIERVYWERRQIDWDIVTELGIPKEMARINNLNIKIENTTAYRGDLKGIVERKFRTINDKVKQKAPGAI